VPTSLRAVGVTGPARDGNTLRVTRIVAGSAGGRRLAVPPGERTRPTSDRAREALFATLSGLVDLDGARALDLYAGSGAVGLEAVSRGAAHALLVDSDARAVAVARDNARALGLAGRVTVRRDRVERVLAGTPEPHELVFADPPYALPDDELAEVLHRLAEGWLAPGAVLVVERSSRGAGPRWPDRVEGLKQRRYGEGTLWYGRFS
jgi:16S rRNA (guanine966-N2)-methyltransferase